jgi:CRISPR type III-B/RAMP module RAMP protein Cmr1
MRVSFKTVTPLFTGDRITGQQRAWGKLNGAEILRPMSLIGSLRFWAGAMARGLGHDVPAATGGKFPEIKSAEDAENKLDPVTYLFGCTGWRKAFNLTVGILGQSDLIQVNEAHVLANLHGWHLKPGFFHNWNKSVPANFDWRPNLKREFKDRSRNWLQHLWLAVDCLFPLGAHQGWGYGMVKLNDGTRKSMQEGLSELQKGKGFSDPGFLQNSFLPDLADFVFAEYEFKLGENIKLQPLGTKNSDFFEAKKKLDWKSGLVPALPLPIGLSLRYALRGYGKYKSPFGHSKKDNWENYFFGDVGKNKPAGRFNCSLVYKTDKDGEPKTDGEHQRFRLWAWFPKGYFSQGDFPAGTPNSWCDAAKKLRAALQDKNLWKAILQSGDMPKEVFFWPLNSTIPKSGIPTGLSSILTKIEKRVKTTLGRTCVP